MKRIYTTLTFLTLLLALPLQASAYNREFVTGEDWVEKMSPREKFMSLMPPTLVFQEYDVHLKLSLPQYILLIDKVMERNPRLENEDIANIFASTIYLFEPENRPKLSNMEEDFLKGDYSPEKLAAPLK